MSKKLAVVELAESFQALGLEPTREYRFAKPRRWRFDFAWPAPGVMLAVEVDGGSWSGGRHVTGAGFEADHEKFNAATLLGWRVLRFTSSQVRSKDGYALNTILTALYHMEAVA